MNTLVNEWLDFAQKDLSLIEKIISDESLTSMVTFHAQQCIEKSFKAVLESNKQPIIKTHNLERLYENVRTYIELDIDSELIEQLNEAYIDSRYPGDLGLLPNGKPTLIDANAFYVFAKETFEAIYKALEDNK